jgi:hypothetical protein
MQRSGRKRRSETDIHRSGITTRCDRGRGRCRRGLPRMHTSPAAADVSRHDATTAAAHDSPPQPSLHQRLPLPVSPVAERGRRGDDADGDVTRGVIISGSSDSTHSPQPPQCRPQSSRLPSSQRDVPATAAARQPRHTRPCRRGSDERAAATTHRGGTCCRSCRRSSGLHHTPQRRTHSDGSSHDGSTHARRQRCHERRTHRSGTTHAS